MEPAMIVASPLGADATLVILRGSIGALDADGVTAGLAAVARAGIHRAVVDVTEANITDPDVLTAIYDLARALRARDGLLALVAPPRGELTRIVRQTGLDAAFTTYDTRRAALDDLDLPDPI
jgi:anti-anti-sigma regulatory factor